MSKEFKLFDRNENTFKIRLIRTMDLLVSNKSTSRLESIMLLSISYLQLLSGFYSEDLGLFSENSSMPDSLLTLFKNIVRVKDLFKNNFQTYQTLMYVLLIVLLSMTLTFFYSVYISTRKSFYSFKEMLINNVLKIFIYVLLTPILDLCLSIICFTTTNPVFPSETCSLGSYPVLTVVCIILFFSTIIIAILLSLFYNDSLLLSNNYFARISCNYEVYHTINVICFAILLNLQNTLGALIFLIYNLIQSLVFVKFVFEKYLYYDKTTNFLVLMFHMVYAWTSFFSLIYYFLPVQQKSFLYFGGAALTIYTIVNISRKIEDEIVLQTPFYKIRNKYHIMFYIKSLIDKINNLDNNSEDKAEFIGIVQMHINECPLTECLAKKKLDLYLPVTNEWSYRNTLETSDRVYMLNFVTFVFSYFVVHNLLSPDLLVNISAYYLIIMGNFCQSIIYHKKVTDFELTYQENFSYMRNCILISKALVEKLRPSNEICNNMEEVDTTMYFKYDFLSEKFFEEINNDVNYNIEFWKIFKTAKEEFKALDFNKIFYLTDRIRISKNKIENLWSELFETYNGFNDIFDLYQNYIEGVNDDEINFRELEGLKKRIILTNEQIGAKNNLYNMVFSKDTAIIILSGDKGKEGMIEKTNENITTIFKWSEEELKGVNINTLIPRNIEKNHKYFMEKYASIGEKKVVDRPRQTYAIDKNNNIIVVTICVKLFPILGDSIYFCGMVNREQYDDIILLDNKFMIQGMSAGLMETFKLNQNLFHDSEVPFYLLCSDFINHFRQHMNKDPNEFSMVESQKFENFGKFDKSKNAAESYEISENSGMEIEIKIPQMLKLFVSRANKKENGFEDFTYIKSTSFQEDKIDIIAEQSQEEEDDDKMYEDSEDKSLVSERDEDDPRTERNNKMMATLIDEDKEFQNRINYFKNFFDKKQFDQLDREIDRINLETRDNDKFKFIFTFNKYVFGDNTLSYVVRCIDNREDEVVSLHSEPEEEKQQEMKKSETVPGATREVEEEVGFNRRNTTASMNTFYEINKEDKEALAMYLNDYYRLAQEDSNFSEALNKSRKESLISSRIYGLKKSDVLVDEASFQSAASSFLENLSKKARVEEIKFGIMKNVHEFYALKAIKFIFACVIILTLLFSVLYYFIIDGIFSTSLAINELNSVLFTNAFSMINFVSSVVSMKSIYEITLNFPNIKYNTFTGNSNYKNYFNFQKDFCYVVSSQIKSQNAYIEYNFTMYLQEQAYLYYWDTIYAGYSLPVGQGSSYRTEFPIGLQKSLTNAESLLHSYFFSLDYLNNLTTDGLSYEVNSHYEFYSYSAIEYSYDYLIPHQLRILKDMTSLFSSFNSQNLNQGLNAIIVYSSIIIALVLLYIVYLYTTNKNMEQTLRKVSRISIMLVDETINRIQNFNDKVLSRYRMKDKIVEIMVKDEQKEKAKKQVKKEDAEKFAFEENKKFRQLTVLNWSYFQVLLILSISSLALIPIYFKTMETINNANSLLATKKFFYGDLLSVSSTLLSIKCVISNCAVNSDIVFNNAFDSLAKQSVVQQISFYPELNDYYNNYYLVSFCDSLYGVKNVSSTYNTTSLKTCLSDATIRTGVNFESMIQSVFNSVDSIKKDLKIQNLNKNTSYQAYSTNYFATTEYTFYNYLVNFPPVFDYVFSSSLENYFTNSESSILNLLLIFSIFLVLFSLFIIFIYTKTLVHLLLISRCILKIIPTSVINKTPELEEWIEHKY